VYTVAPGRGEALTPPSLVGKGVGGLGFIFFNAHLLGKDFNPEIYFQEGFIPH